MAYTVLQLITMAYYEAGINARDLQTAGGSQFSDGLQYFNEVLASTFIDEGIVPFYKSIELTLEDGVETQFVPNLIEAETLTFFQDGVRYSVGQTSRREYWGTPKATNVQTLPGIFRVDRTTGGSNVSVTYTADKDYPAELWGLFALEEAVLNDDLYSIYDKYYVTYLRLYTAIFLCMSYNQEVPSGVQKLFTKYDHLIRKRSAQIDLKNDIISVVSRGNSINYAQVNIGKQFTTWSRR